jgi:hypothetical protein
MAEQQQPALPNCFLPSSSEPDPQAKFSTLSSRFLVPVFGAWRNLRLVQLRRRAAALLELLAAAAGAGLIAADLGAQAPRPLALGHGLP